jgi:transposase InsO family protein
MIGFVTQGTTKLCDSQTSFQLEQGDGSQNTSTLNWVNMYLETGDAGLTCRRCGISRPTLGKWVKRFEQAGMDGLQEQSRRPKHSPNRKVTSQEETWILELPRERQLGSRRIQSELRRLHSLEFSLATIQKVLQKHKTEPLVKPRWRKQPQRYSRPIPGDRVPMDTIKIAPGLYQYTAIDDCTRYQVMALYPRWNAANTLQFLETVIEQMPFPIQRIQTDRGREFTAYKVRDTLLSWGIKWCPNRPASPHLNGKVERVQKTNLREFYAIMGLSRPDLADELAYF